MPGRDSKGRDEAKEPVALLHALFDQAPVMIGLTRGAEHRFILANRVLQQMAGRDPTGQTLDDALPELADQGIGNMIDKVLATGEPLHVPELRIRMQGAPRVQILDVMLQRLATGGGGDVLCIGYEITDRVEAELRLHALEVEMAQVARTAAFGTMAATLAHEINQPLAASAAYLSAGRRIALAIDDPRAGEAAQALTLAEQQIQRAGEIVRQARRAMEDEMSTREDASLGLMIDEALRLLAAVRLIQGVRTEIAPGCAGITVRVNRIQIEQILVNVIRNAVEAMAGLDPKIISFDAAIGGEMAHLRISDTGRGLDGRPGSIKCFVSTTGGMGLGLALSRTIVEAHGGRIAIEAREPRGAVVLVSLPLAAPLADR